MKKYLLLIISMVCAVTGAWAENAVVTYNQNSPSTITVETKDDPDLSGNYAKMAIWNNQTEASVSDQDVFTWSYDVMKVVGTISQTGLNQIVSKNTNTGKFDMSQATQSSTDPWISFPSIATSVILANDTQIPNITWGSNTNYVYSAASTGDNYYLYVKSGVTASQISELNTSELTGNKVLNITGPGAKALKTELMASPYSVAAANLSVPFDGTISVTGVAAGALQTAVEAALTADGGTTATLTSLTIGGALNSTDLEYIAGLTALRTLDLTDVTTDVSDIASNYVTTLTMPSSATALPNNIATNLPNLTSSIYVYSYSNNQLNSLDAYLITGDLSNLIEDLKTKTSNNLQQQTANATVKIRGALNSSDISTANTYFSSTNTLDYSEATGITVNDITGNHEIIKLPANSTMPTDAQGTAWTSGGGWSKMIVYSLSSDGQTLSIWSNFAVENNTTGKSLYSVVTADNIDNKVGDYTGVQYVKIFGRNSTSPFANDFSTVVEKLAEKKIGQAKDPIEYDDCKVTINLASRGSKTMSELITDAETELAKSSKTICTLIVTGELSTTDLESLDDANTANRIDLSGATIASGASVDNIQVPTTSLVSLVLPPAQTVSSALETTLGSCTNLEYVYSNSSDNGATTPTYVWIAKTGVMAHVFANESSLQPSVYVKVAAKTGVSLDANSVDLSATGMTNLAFLDVSESGLTKEAAASYKCPSNNTYKAYRIILPNNWSGDDMAVFAANPNHGAMAAVYSYNGTTLKILEIDDNSYSPAALADSRIMRSTTTDVDVVSGYYNGNTYANFGTNLLTALNNMGKSVFSVTTKNAQNEDVVTNYTNTAGLNVRTICIETASAAPNELTFDNPSITTLNVKGLVQANADLNVNACSALTTLDLTSSSIKSVTANNTHIASADFTSTAISGATDFSGATALATLTTTDETTFNGALNLSQTAFTSFTSNARHGGDISFNQCPNLASINVTAADFANTSSKIHIDADAENAENTTILSTLNTDKCIKIPSDFETSRLHPAPASNLVEQASAVAAAVTYTATDMTFHDNNTNDAYYPTYRYWYQGTTDNEGIATLGTSNDRRLATIISDNANLKNNSHAKIKIVGPLTSEDIDALDDLNCTMLDISEATIETGLLKTKLTAGDILNSNTKFLVLPDTCSREHIVNGTMLAKLANVYSVIAVKNTAAGRDLTSWSRVAGALQPAVVGALNNDAQSWSLTPSGQPTRNIYTSSVSNFKALKISGLINSYDLSKANSTLDADGHLTWTEDVVENTSQTRTRSGDYEVNGPFSSCFLLTEIDLRDAYFEPKPGQTGLGEESVYFRYYYSDMTLSALDIISTSTYKVVIPQNKKVREIPADFMRCSTNIRAICIPSNIQAIRTRAFYTIDYVWTTPDAYASGNTTADPEGGNTRLDNGAKLSDGTAVSALTYNTTTGKYEENSAFEENKYYTADYSGVNGGGTYTFGSTLKLIETGAFANTQPNVSDVYVLNTTAPECHVDAFNTVMYTGNGGYNSAKVSSEGIITRDAYYNGRWITMLHYPRQTTDPQIQRYTDPTRDYSIATGMRDGKGAILYFPNQSEFIRAYQQGTYGYVWNAWNPTRSSGSVNNGTLTNTTEGWTAANQTVANSLFDAYSTGTNHQYTSFYKVSGFTGSEVTAPTATIVPYNQVNWNTSTYTYSTESPGNLYPVSEIDNNNDADGSGERTSKDYRGWHQFVLNAYAANTILDEEPYRSYISDNEWWTICPEFDITRSEAIKLFGTPNGWAGATEDKLPYVSKLRYVRRTYGENGNNVIHLNFSDNLMTHKEARATSTSTITTNSETQEVTVTNASQHGTLDNSNGVVTITNDAPGDNDVVMSAGVPYMIKPNLTLSEGSYNRQFRVLTSTDYEKLSTEEKNSTSPRYIESNDLYNKIKAAQEMSGTNQKAIIKSGTYTVPVFVSGTSTEGAEGSYTIDGVSGYKKSTVWHYTFVGTWYKSFLPHHCYFLGWDSANKCAKFYYHNGNYATIDNEMRWANGTGIILPVTSSDLDGTGAFKYSVTEAKDMAHPAQWTFETEFSDDSFAASSAPRMYVMDFNSPDVTANDGTTMIESLETDALVNGAEVNVYSLDGRKVGSSLEGLAKGIYIVNGKKYVVK